MGLDFRRALGVPRGREGLWENSSLCKGVLAVLAPEAQKWATGAGAQEGASEAARALCVCVCECSISPLPTSE